MKKKIVNSDFFGSVRNSRSVFFNSGNYHYAEWPPLSGDGRGDSG